MNHSIIWMPPKLSMVVLLVKEHPLSSALLGLPARHRIPLLVYSSSGYSLAHPVSFRYGRTKLKKRQHEAQKGGRGSLAKCFAVGRILN